MYVLITGTTSGLGREFARIFAKNGISWQLRVARVLCGSRSRI